MQPHATAFAHRHERFLLKRAVSLDPAASNSDRDDARTWLTRSWALAHRYGSGGVFPNFADPDLDAWATASHRSNRNRLLQVKARYDPENVFRSDRVAALERPDLAVNESNLTQKGEPRWERS